MTRGEGPAARREPQAPSRGEDPAARHGPRVLVLSAPSGAGKSSLARALAGAEPSVRLSVSHTTRVARPGEVDGVDYHFVGTRAFEAMVKDGAFLEYARVFDRYYGTSREAVRSELSRGHDVVLDIDWQGARQVRESFAATVSVFILPPSIDALRSRLVGRGQDSAETIDRRMRAARSELEHYDEFDHIVVNDDFDRTLDALRGILRGRSAMSSGDAGPLVAALLAPRHPD